MSCYQEYPPPPALRPYVTCLWTAMAEPGEGPHVHRVLPDNGIDILWQDQAPAGFAVGMMTAAVDVVTRVPVQTVAVRFKPGGAVAFFNRPLHDLRDLHVDLPDLWGGGQATGLLAEALWGRSGTVQEQLDILGQCLVERFQAQANVDCSPTTRRAAALVEQALIRIDGSHGQIRVETLAESLGVSRQHLASLFRARVGLSAKVFARICRFQRAAEGIKNAPKPDVDWATLALEFGYFDQSHLVHEFREFSGNSPGVFASLGS